MRYLHKLCVFFSPLTLLRSCDLLFSERVNRYHQLLGDVLPDIPSSLLVELLHEELIHQKELDHFQPATTGGALACLPNPECQNEAFLIYPSGEALNSISILFLCMSLRIALNWFWFKY